MQFSVREAGDQDAGGIVACVRAVFDEYGFTWEEEEYHADLYEPDRHYRDQGHTFWVAESEGSIIGTCALERFTLIEGEPGQLTTLDGFIRIAGTDCALQRLYVPSQHRKEGVGSTLFEQALGTAADESKQAMEIWSDKRFEAAHRLYQRKGARVAGDRICHDPDQSPEWGLWLALSQA